MKLWPRGGWRLAWPLALLCCVHFVFDGAPATAFELERRINTWLVSGPFSNTEGGLLKTDLLGNEREVLPGRGDPAGSSTWQVLDDRLYCRNQDDYVDLFTWFLPGRTGAPPGGNEHAVAYAHTYIWAPFALDAVLLLGVADGAVAWLNGVQVALLETTSRSPVRDEASFPLPLNTGWNRLLLKVANTSDVWGFYAKIADPNGAVVDGLEYSVDRPDGDLRIITETLPVGFAAWPYVWDRVRDTPLSRVVTSASPFRFQAAGGTPPYTWTIQEGTLPAGIFLEGDEGELLGLCPEDSGRQDFTVQVRDAAGVTAKRPLALEVRERPTAWVEHGKIGGLIHGTNAVASIHGPPEEQARLMAAQGYVYACPTTGYWPGVAEWPGPYDPRFDFQTKFGFHPPGAFLEAFNRVGIRFGSYLNVRDATAYVYPAESPDYRTWPAYNAFMHRYLYQWAKLARPSVIWLDGVHLPAPSPDDNRGYDFDALYSVVRTVSPETLIIANSAGFPRADFAFGDCDLFSTEGHNDSPNDCYWDRWPAGVSGLRAKSIPNESWRYPVAGQRDWQEWARVAVSMIAEGYILNLDHSYTPELAAMHEQLGRWLGPRLESLQGTRPGPAGYTPDWGYRVSRDTRVYLHILMNKRGKQGIGADGILRAVPVDGRVGNAALVPGGERIRYTQSGATVDVDLAGIALDPVDTIVRLTLE